MAILGKSALVLIVAAGSASAQMATAPTGPRVVCPPILTIPRELAGWTGPRPLTAATTQRELGLATLSIGAGVRATLVPIARIAYPLAPEHRPDPGSRGGLFAFTVTEAGTYRVALGGTGWIDVVADGRPVASSAHGHGPDCTGIRKQVDFPLKPGRYLLQISGVADPMIEVMVAHLPV